MLQLFLKQLCRLVSSNYFVEIIVMMDPTILWEFYKVSGGTK